MFLREFIQALSCDDIARERRVTTSLAREKRQTSFKRGKSQEDSEALEEAGNALLRGKAFAGAQLYFGNSRCARPHTLVA